MRPRDRRALKQRKKIARSNARAIFLSTLPPDKRSDAAAQYDRAERERRLATWLANAPTDWRTPIEVCARESHSAIQYDHELTARARTVYQELLAYYRLSDELES